FSGDNQLAMSAGTSFAAPAFDWLRFFSDQTMTRAILGAAALAILLLLITPCRRRLGAHVIALSPGLGAALAILVWRGDEIPAMTPLAPLAVILATSAAVSIATVARVPIHFLLVVGLLVAVGFFSRPVFIERGLERTENAALRWMDGQVPMEARVLREADTSPLSPERFEITYVDEVGLLGSDAILESTHFDYVMVSSTHFDDSRQSENRGALAAYEALDHLNPAARFCPREGEFTGPEVWVVPLSPRARQLHGNDPTYISGTCREWF
ncbi:MAG: hypothetical protein KC561_08340, partial [Myxococcales bacterium]|nr:hypothetical protein [Myxococcales bacterium]